MSGTEYIRTRPGWVRVTKRPRASAAGVASSPAETPSKPPQPTTIATPTPPPAPPRERPGSDPPPLLALPADAIGPEPIEWLWPQRFALGKLGLLIGDPDTGKSLVTLDMAARV